MGNIKKVLAAGELPYRSVTPTGIWGDLCENVHLHFRNTRFDFSEDEWAKFRAAIHSIGMAGEKACVEHDFREGDPNFLVQLMYNEQYAPDSDYYPNRATIELERDNTVHFHIRDMRLHWTFEEYRQIAEMFRDSLETLSRVTDFAHSEVSEPTRVTVPIDSVQPYDAGHRPLAEDEVHRNGIEYVKSLIANGERIRPILVATDGQRLDGYKRYMAQLECGLTEVEVIVDPNGMMGGQHGQSAIDDENSIYGGSNGNI